jgi:NAD(P)-dependent dehydrogenase (short-subunit alcohol dehydrogenase family)
MKRIVILIDGTWNKEGITSNTNVAALDPGNPIVADAFIKTTGGDRHRAVTGRREVMLCDIEDAALVKAVADLKLTNADVDGVRADVSLKAELQAAADATIARHGKVHILVNNAGVGGGGSYGRWSDASWNWTLGVNLMSVVWGVEIFGPLIEAHGEGGQIVSTASIAGLIAGAGPAYNVTKYGVVALSEGLR